MKQYVSCKIFSTLSTVVFLSQPGQGIRVRRTCLYSECSSFAEDQTLLGVANADGERRHNPLPKPLLTLAAALLAFNAPPLGGLSHGIGGHSGSRNASSGWARPISGQEAPRTKKLCQKLDGKGSMVLPQMSVMGEVIDIPDHCPPRPDNRISIIRDDLKDFPLEQQEEEFTVKQYNVLAARMSNNTAPWMLQGAGVSTAQRTAIWKKFNDHDPSWREELTEEQWQQVKAVNDKFFNWNVRKDLLLKEMLFDNPDILTLQEIDKYEEFFRPALDNHGYGHVYEQRIGKTDGVAIAYNKDRYQLLEKSERFHLPNEGDLTPLHLPGSASIVADDDQEELVAKACSNRSAGGYGEAGGRIAVFVLLQDKVHPDRKVVVGTTHLDKSPNNPEKSKSRVNQMSVLNVLQGHLARRWRVCLERDIFLLAGDFNTDMKEVTMVTKPALAGEDYHLTEMSIHPDKDSCSTMTEDRHMWIDYIFHAGQAEVLSTEPWKSPTEPIPNHRQASDHMPVTAKFTWRRPEDEIELLDLSQVRDFVPFS